MRGVRSLAAVVALGACAACASPHRTGPVQSLLEARRAGVVMQRWDLSCGAAALATLLTYQHGDPVAEQEVARALLRGGDPARVKARGGFSLLELKRYAQARGYRAAGYQGVTLDQLAAMAPAIVSIDLGDYKHFVVFRARVGERVLVADPAYGNRWLARERFERAWVQGIAFAVTRADGRPSPGRLAPQPQDLQIPAGAAVMQALR